MFWSVRPSHRTCHHMPWIHLPPLSYKNFCQSPFSACVHGCHEHWASVIQPPSWDCFHCARLQVSAIGLHSRRHQQAVGYLACPAVLYTVKWHRWIRKIPSFPCMHFSIWMHVQYSNTSSSISPCRSRRSALTPSFSLHKGLTVTRWTMLNLLPCPYNFPISGRNIPSGARQSGIWEGEVLLRPKAQQHISFDQWVSSAYCCMRAET